MTIYIKNLTNSTIVINSLKIGIHQDETRKVIADFENEYVDTKAELDLLVDDNKIEIIDEIGKQIKTSDLFQESLEEKNKEIKANEIKTEETESERFYYLEDFFCIEKGAYVSKTFKGNVDTVRINVKNANVKYRFKSQGVAMPWQLLKMDKENILNFEYRLKDPILEILADKADAALNVYIDGFVTGISSNDLQHFIDTWYEHQTDCNVANEWGADIDWWLNSQITSDEWNGWDWTSKIGSFIEKTITDYEIAANTIIVQQHDGAKLLIPANYTDIVDDVNEKYKIFQNDQGIYTIELVAFNNTIAWDPKLFKVKVKNIRYIEFLDQTVDVTLSEIMDWDDRWTDPEYYFNTGMKFISSSAGYKSALGSYTVDLNNKPKTVTLLIDDQSLLTPEEFLASLPADNYDFFIIANGASAVTMDSTITFDNSGSYPQLLIDGVASNLPVYFSDPALNYDGCDHFIYKSDGNGGTNIFIEDLPNLGDKDFTDIVLNVNFPMTDKILQHAPETIEDKLEQEGCNMELALKTKSSGINLYALGKSNDCYLWKLRNGTDSDLNVMFTSGYGYTEYLTIPAKTDVYKATEYKFQSKLFWYEEKNGYKQIKYRKKRASSHKFDNSLNLKKEVLSTVTKIDKTIFEN